MRGGDAAHLVEWNCEEDYAVPPRYRHNTICFYRHRRQSERVCNCFICTDTFCDRVLFWIFLADTLSEIIILCHSV